MSTLGAGQVAIGAGAGQVAIGAGAGVAAIGMLAGAAVIGTGILIVKGVMWCGQKMEENYVQTCKQWTELENNASAENRANVQEVSSYLTSQLNYISASEFASRDQVTSGTVDQKALDQAIARARATLVDNSLIAQNKATTERNMLASRLQAEIKAGRGILAPEIISEAEGVTTGSTASIKAMLNKLDDAWNTIHETQSLQTRAVQQAQQLLTLTSARLRAIEAMLRDMGAVRDLAYQKRLRQIQDVVIDAGDELKSRPEQALFLANNAQKEAETLLEEVSANAYRAWNNQLASINSQLGIMGALSTMLEEAEATKLLDTQKVVSLKQRVATLQQRTRTLLQSSNAHIQDGIQRLTAAVEILQHDVFAEVQTSQQSTIATTIQTTLTELGFQSDARELPSLKINGDTMRVEVMASQAATDDVRDDKIITFDVSRDGQVSYDFSGYVGEACLEDAQRVFAALSQKGIYIIDNTAMNTLQNLPVEQVLPEALQQFQSTPVKNKTQAELAETIKGVLDKMGYANVRTSSIGGSIEMEAFDGSVGYRVVMSPEGEVQIFKDADQDDITSDMRDPIVQASHVVQEESQEEDLKERRKSYVAPRKAQKLSN